MSTKKSPLASNDDEIAFSFAFDNELEGLDLSNVLVENESSKLYDILQAIEGLEGQQRMCGFRKWFVPGTEFGIDKLPKHRAWFAAGSQYRERYFSGSNRTSKTVSGAFETAVHATGLYPDWWEGKVFDKPVDMWAVGTTANTTRDIVQKQLMGPLEAIGTGMIPAELILETVKRPNSGGAFDYVKIRHKSGGVSTIAFKSYEQKRVAFEGTAQHGIWLDEMPPYDIYSECLIRTATTKGIIYTTATPLAGLTPFLLSFFNRGDFIPYGSDIPAIVKMSREDEEQSIREKMAAGELDIIDLKRYREEKSKPTTKAVLVCGWDDAPWLDEETKQELRDSCPPHELAARTTGLPSMGAGSVFTIPLEDIIVSDFEIPEYWKKICGFDVGWRNTAAVWLAQNPDTDEWFLYSEYKEGKVEPLYHADALKRRGDWINVAIDPASRASSQSDGKQLFNTYRQMGVKVFAANNARESSIYDLQQAFGSGKLKIFKSLQKLQAEYMTYRRAENGKILKENDHCLSGDTLVWTSEGKLPIKDLVGFRGKVKTLNGEYVPFKNCRLTRKQSKVVEVLFEDGGSLICTPDHKLLSAEGWIEAIDSSGYLVYNVGTEPLAGETKCKSKSTKSQPLSKSSSESGTTCVETTSSGMAYVFTDLCGNTTTEKSPRGFMSTTKTTTSPTTLSRISNYSISPSISLTTKKATTERPQNLPMNVQQNGTDQSKGENGILLTMRDSKTSFTRKLSETVHSAVRLTRRLASMAKTLSAQISAKLLSGARRVLTTWKKPVPSAGQCFPLTSIQSRALAHASAGGLLSPVAVKAVNILESSEDVYCLEVPRYECFVVNNGVVVHNCIDALRYAWVERKHAKQPPLYRAKHELTQGGTATHGSKQYDI